MSRVRWLPWLLVALLVVVPALQLAAGAGEAQAKPGHDLSVGKLPWSSGARQVPTVLELTGRAVVLDGGSLLVLAAAPPFVPPER